MKGLKNLKPKRYATANVIVPKHLEINGRDTNIYLWQTNPCIMKERNTCCKEKR